MARVLVATAACEGGFISPVKDYSAPIRLFNDRWIEDDIVLKYCGRVKRERLTRRKARAWRKAAKENRKMGRV